jgi:hypothetical protein
MRTTLLAAVAALAPAACASSPAVSTAHVTSAQVATAQAADLPLRAPRTEPKAWGPIEDWRTTYPMAARTLEAWRDEYPNAARRLVVWDERHTQDLEVLVDWAMTYPHERIGAFFLSRSGGRWDELSAIARDEPEATEAFLQWARHSGLAAENLAMHAGGLSVGASLIELP